MTQIVIDSRTFDAVIFDLDGVITKTAAVHERAWAELFNEYLRNRSERNNEPFEAFTTNDYGQYVDGKPRYDGVQSFLQSREIDLPWGDSSDPPERETVCGLGNRKNDEFLRIMETEGVEPYPSSVRLVRALQEAGIATALFSSSRNAGPVLEAAGLGDLFTVRVDGRVAGDLGLPGKPHPAFLLEATRRIEATPERTAVVEDAQSGVAAGRAGEFALVIGVDRIGQAQELLDSGADVVVADLGEIAVDSRPPQPMVDLPGALDHEDELAQLLDGRRVVVFLDYDGTLTPIVEHPDMAILEPEARATLEALCATTSVAIVSGRDVADVIDKVGVPGLYYAGSHGFDIRAPSGEPIAVDEMAQFDAFLAPLDAAEAQLRTRLADVPGANVERKRFAVAVHYRQVAPEHQASVAAAVDAIAPDHPTLRVAGGKMIFELRPDFDWDKGKALEWLLTEMGLDGPDVVPVYVGDDITDEDAFRALHPNGIGVVVGRESRLSAADYAVEDTDQARAFLDTLRTLITGGGA